MAEKDFVYGSENLDSSLSDRILGVITECSKKGIMPISANASELLVTNPAMFKSIQSEMSKGKIFLKSGKTMEALVVGGLATTGLPKDAVNEIYDNLQSRVSNLPDVENAPSVQEFITAALKQCEAFRVNTNVSVLNAIKDRVLSTVLSVETATSNVKAAGLDLDPVPSAN